MWIRQSDAVQHQDSVVPIGEGANFAKPVRVDLIGRRLNGNVERPLRSDSAIVWLLSTALP